MAYDAKDIKDIVRMCDDAVRPYDADAQKWREVEDGSFNYASLIPDELYRHPTGSQTPMVVRRPGLSDDRKIIESVIGWPARITVDLSRMGPEADAREDQLEAFFAYHSYRCDPRGALKDLIHHHQALWQYSGYWLSVVPYNPPRKRQTESTKDYDYRKEEYDRTYWRYRWEVPTPTTVSFLPYQGGASMACMYEELNVIDFMELYAERKDEDDLNPLTLYDKQFSWLRATDGTQPERGNETEWFNGNKKVRRWLVDNGTTICHQVEAGGSRGPTSRTYGDFHEVVTEQPNTFGRTSFVLIHSDYRTAGVRFSPLIATLAQAYHNVTVNQSLYKTMLVNDKWLTALPPDVAQDIARSVENNPDDVKLLDQYRADLVPGSVTPVMGQPVNASNLPQKWWEDVQYYEAQLQEVRGPILRLTPDDTTQRNAPATTILAAQQQGLRTWERPTTSFTTGMQQGFEMVAHDVIYGLNPHLANVGPYKTNNRGFREGEKEMPFTAGDYTKGPYQPASRIEKGKAYSLSPEAFKEFLDSGRVTVEPIADTDATRAARVQIEMALYNNEPRMATIKDVLTAKGETDLTKRLAELDSDRLYQEKVPMLDNLLTVQFLETEAARTGQPVDEIAMKVGMPRPVGGNGDNFNAQQNAINSTRVSPPAGPMPSDRGV